MSKITIARVYRVTDGSALVTNMSNVSPANGGNIQVEAITDFDVPSDGESRYVVIDSEEIAYTDIDETTDELLNITRAANSTVAASHTPGTFVQAGLTERREKFADGYVDDDDALAQGVEILRHLWRYYPTGTRENDEMEIASVRYQDDGTPIIVDAPDTSENEDLGSPSVVTWSKTGALTTGVREHQFPAPFGGQIEEARLTLGENGAASGASVIADVLVNGVSILTTKLTIAAGATISDAVEPTTKEITKGDLIQIEFEQIGSTDSGWDLTLYLTVWPTADAMVGRIEVPGPTGADAELDYGTTSEIANVVATEAAGTSDLVARADHVHRLGIVTTKGDLLAHNGTDPIRLPVGASDLVLTADAAEASGLRWGVASGGGLPSVFVRKTSDESVTSSITLQNDNDLAFAVGANEIWVAKCVLIVSGSQSGDIKCLWNAPAGATFVATGQGLASNTTATTGSIQDGTHWGAGTELAFGIDTNRVGIVYDLMVVNGGTAGTVQLQWAQLSSTGTATVVHAHSHLLGWQVA